MKSNSKNRILVFFAKEAWRHKKLSILILIITPLTVILERYIAPLFIAYVLFHIQSADITIASSIWLLVGYFLIQLFGIVIAYRLILWLMWALQVRGEAHLYRVAYDKLSKQSLAFYANTFTGSLVSKVNRFTAAYMEFVNAITYNLLFVLTAVVGTIVGISFFMWQLSLALLILTVAFAISAYFGTRFMRKRFLERSAAYNEISGKLADSVSNMLAVKTDAREKDERKLLGVSIDNMLVKEMAARSGMVRVQSVYSTILMLMRMSAIIVSILAIQTGFGNAAIIYLALTYTFNLIEEIWNISNILRSYYQITGDTAETLELLEQAPDIEDRTNRKLKVTKPVIEFHNVHFAHDDQQKPLDDAEEDQVINEPEPLFSNFSLAVKAHQKVGLVGVSGSGKSTLLRLLMRFYDIDRGKITIDSQDIARVTQESLHQNLAYVPQEPLMFHRTIKENIAYSRPDATDEAIRSAASKANALEFIEKLPNGFETLVGERGVKLSGGQRQRIAIARAILKDAPILILDEATSALDSESEAYIQDALKKLMKNRTSIVIAHRLSTIADLDRIIVLDEGKIVEEGTHKELLAKKGTYAKLWAHQSGGFLEE